tara:strand:+ start:252 stop:503 length:252 start_codon:yes stop_codon:yes gene_type:complete
MALIENITKKPRLKRETSPIDTSLWDDEAKQDFAKSWRNEELKKTDWICAIPDHGLHVSYMAYRTLLRDWPTTSDFPDTKPTL